jgi:hypothetical protein
MNLRKNYGLCPISTKSYYFSAKYDRKTSTCPITKTLLYVIFTQKNVDALREILSEDAF